MIRVGLVGAGGYSGAELLRLLLQHPHCQEVTLFSSTLESIYEGNSQLPEDRWQRGRHYEDYAAIYPAFYGLGLKICGLPADAPDKRDEWEVFYRSFDLIFLATPHAVSAQIVGRYLELHDGAWARIIDLSGALRLKQPELYRLWYHEDTLGAAELQGCQYGLSELYRSSIAPAQIVANPGCYATAAILALAPLAKHGLLGRVRVDAKSGVSGAGKKATESTHFPHANESLSLYKLHKHQHIPEIESILADCAAKSIPPLTFTTHLLPITRGIMATCYVDLAHCAIDFHELYQRFYAESVFVQIRPAGENIPQIRDVSFSNRCDIGLSCNPRNQELVVVSVIDNLLKGASGQAVQNMNLMFGWEEQCGLPRIGALP
ncbi:MAG: N-acetyl-gamma-glutamyl-phosphate reductase [Spirochaetota bacterium]